MEFTTTQEKIRIVSWNERNSNEYLTTKFFDPKLPLAMVSPPEDEKIYRDSMSFCSEIDFSLIYQYLSRTADHFRNKKFSAVLLEKHCVYPTFNKSKKWGIETWSIDYESLKKNFDSIYIDVYGQIPDRRFYFFVADPMFNLKNPIIRTLIIAETDIETLQSQIFFDLPVSLPHLPRLRYDLRLEYFPLFPYENLIKTNDPDMLRKILFFMIRSRPFRFGRLAVSYTKDTSGCVWSNFARDYPYSMVRGRRTNFAETLAPYVDMHENWPVESEGPSGGGLFRLSKFIVNYEEI